MSESPRRLTFVVRHFGLDRMRVLDVGCGKGDYLAHFGPGSVGLELNESYVQAAREKGLDARQGNVTVEGIPPGLGTFDAIWASALIEHLNSPHEFLVSLRQSLNPEGLLVALVPVTGPLRKGPWRGFLAVDHVNFFTPRTFRYTIERGGFDVLWMGSPSLPRAPLAVSRLAAPVSPNVVAVARARRDFQYADKASRLLVDGKIEFRT
ncbi:MAG: class I SAM-dependent methyltransferase [Acidimicrobiia bacterium]